MCLRDLLRYICLQKCQICHCSKCCLPACGMCGWFRSVFDIASQNSRYKQLRHLCACQISCARRRVNIETEFLTPECEAGVPNFFIRSPDLIMQKCSRSRGPITLNRILRFFKNLLHSGSSLRINRSNFFKAPNFRVCNYQKAFSCKLDSCDHNYRQYFSHKHWPTDRSWQDIGNAGSRSATSAGFRQHC